MTAAHRPRDLDDVIQLIKRNQLPRVLEVHDYVQAAYERMWDAAQVDDER